MAKWSGKVFFPTSGQATRSLASGHYPSFPIEFWKSRSVQSPVPVHKGRLEGILVMLDYGLRMMPDARLGSLANILQDELDRNERRWVRLDVTAVQQSVTAIRQEQDRREALLNRSDLLHLWLRPGTSRTTSSWTQTEANSLRDEWEGLTKEDELL